MPNSQNNTGSNSSTTSLSGNYSQGVISAGYAKPPRPLDVSGNMAITWKNWIQQYKWFASAREMDNKSASVQVGTFMSCIGPDAINIFNAFSLTDQEKESVDIIQQKFEQYFAPKTNTTFERYTFNKLVQLESESFDEFLTKAKNQIKKCEYGTLQDSILKDKIIIGIRSSILREKILSGDELTLEQTVKMCKASELATIQLETINKEETVHVIQKVNNQTNNYRKQSVREHGRQERGYNTKNNNCGWCGYNHQKGKCPAFNKVCMNCNKKGHFKQMCKLVSKRNVHVVDDNNLYTDNDESSDESSSTSFVDSLLVLSMGANKCEKDNWFEEIIVNHIPVRFKLDTGAQCNVISASLAKKLNTKIKKSSTKKLIAFNGTTIEVTGEIKVNCTVKKVQTVLCILVIEQPVTPILGRKSCEKLELVKRVQEIMQEDDVLYTGLGCVKHFVYDIDLVTNPTFEIHPARKVPHAIRNTVKEEIDKMVKLKVLKKTNAPTPVVSPMVVVKKNNKIRVCIDPSNLNKNILRRHHPLRTIDEITARLRKSKWFTLLDMKRGFWQIRVSDRTTKYLTMATPWGRYSFMRLPFGLASAPEVFQNMMSEILDGCDNTECSMDDVLIHAETLEELKKFTKIVMNRIAEAGLKLNKEKCIFNVPQIKFLGHLISSQGIKVDPEKVEAINRLKQPTNKTELMRFLGMATYLSKFIKNLSEVTHPLRQLLKNDIEWQWAANQEEAFKKLKALLTKSPVLRFYDPNEDVTLQVDASQHSLGAVLLQNDQPVAYASKAMTECQTRYPQIEKEALAMRVACTKFREYIYGKRLYIETDHKPIESIMKKPLHCSPHRLQRIILEVMQYSPIVTYRKGKEIVLADTLSRDCVNKKETEDDELEVCEVLQMTDESKQQFVKETQSDPDLQVVIKHVLNGWPDKINKLDEKAKPYWTFREELGYSNGILVKGEKVVVPQKLKRMVMEKLHQGHFGVQRTLSRGRELVFWLGMTQDVSAFVQACKACESSQPAKPKEPLIIKDIPYFPWEIVASDLFHFNNNEFLLIVDSFSGFFDFCQLKRTTSSEIIQQFKIWFSTHGIPKVVESDNGPQFASREFKAFAQDWGFKHQTSSPYYPKSNGLAERYVQTAKQLLKRCHADKSDIQLALLNYRNTPRSATLQSPNQRLMGRQTRTVLPVPTTLLSQTTSTDVQKSLAKARNIYKHYADKSSRPQKPFEAGDKVRIQRSHRDWVSGNIIRKLNEPRSYLVKTDDGKVGRRNSIHINYTKANIVPEKFIAVVPNQSSEPITNTAVETQSSQSTQQETAQQQPTPNTSVESPKQQLAPEGIKSRYGRSLKPIQKLIVNPQAKSYVLK